MPSEHAACNQHYDQLNILKIELFIYIIYIICFLLNKSLCTSQANMCNLTFTTGNLFPSHSYIGMT